MRLRIQTPPPPAAREPGPSNPGNVPPATLSPPQRSPVRTVSRTERVIHAITRWNVAVPVLIGAVLSLGWSLAFRLPDPHRTLSAHARALPVKPVPGQEPATPERVTELRRQVQEASDNLCRKPEELGQLLSRLELGARQAGWHLEATIRPALPSPGGLKELTLHPVVLQLEDTGEGAASAASSYHRLLGWFQLVSSLPRRAEVVSIQLRSTGPGLRKAQVELHLFSLNSREETAPK